MELPVAKEGGGMQPGYILGAQEKRKNFRDKSFGKI